MINRSNTIILNDEYNNFNETDLLILLKNELLIVESAITRTDPIKNNIYKSYSFLKPDIDVFKNEDNVWVCQLINYFIPAINSSDSDLPLCTKGYVKFLMTVFKKLFKEESKVITYDVYFYPKENKPPMLLETICDLSSEKIYYGNMVNYDFEYAVFCAASILKAKKEANTLFYFGKDSVSVTEVLPKRDMSIEPVYAQEFMQTLRDSAKEKQEKECDKRCGKNRCY